MERRYPKGVPLLSPEEDMSVDSSAFRKAQRWDHSCPSPDIVFAMHEQHWTLIGFGVCATWKLVCRECMSLHHGQGVSANRKMESAESALAKHLLADAPDLDARLAALAAKQARSPCLDTKLSCKCLPLPSAQLPCALVCG